jgi:hypothetical protein
MLSICLWDLYIDISRLISGITAGKVEDNQVANHLIHRLDLCCCYHYQCLRTRNIIHYTHYQVLISLVPTYFIYLYFVLIKLYLINNLLHVIIVNSQYILLVTDCNILTVLTPSHINIATLHFLYLNISFRYPYIPNP